MTIQMSNNHNCTSVRHPRKNLTPALESLLSSTNISSRNRRPSFQLLSFPKQNVSSPSATKPSRIRKGLNYTTDPPLSSVDNSVAETNHHISNVAPTSKNSASPNRRQRQPFRQYFADPSTNLTLNLHIPQPAGQHRNDLEDPTLEDAAQQAQLFSIDYAVSSQHHILPLSEDVLPPEAIPADGKPLWQILQEEEDEEEDDDASTGSFSSISSSLSSRFPTSVGSTDSGIATPRAIARKSLSVLRSGNRMVGSCSVDDSSHPLSAHPSSASLQDLTEFEQSESKPLSFQLRSKSIVTALSAHFKAFKSAASSFSQSQHSLMANMSADVFTFSPRSTDERVPQRFSAVPVTRSGRGMTVPHVSVARRKMTTQSASAATQRRASQTSAPSLPQTPPRRSQELETFSLQEVTLPPPPRTRDIRENPDFLRVYALEGLMRKHGKLDPGFEGKACVALVPRADKVPGERAEDGPDRRFPKYLRAGEVELKRDVPKRWIGVSVDDI